MLIVLLPLKTYTRLQWKARMPTQEATDLERKAGPKPGDVQLLVFKKITSTPPATKANPY
jgi:hypothetical protein